MKKGYDCYVTLAHVHRDGRLIPGVGAVRRTDTPDWRSLLLGGNMLGVWLVEGSTKNAAADLVLAHLAGHAPHGVTWLYRKPQPKATQPPVFETGAPA